VYLLAIMGSPRLRGNTDILLDEVLAGAGAKAEARGTALESEKVCLRELRLKPCRACDTCHAQDADGCVGTPWSPAIGSPARPSPWCVPSVTRTPPPPGMW